MFEEGVYQFGLVIDLPIDRLDERNALRRSIIAQKAAVRDYIADVDAIKQAIRELLRELERPRKTYKIAVDSVALALRRVEPAGLAERKGSTPLGNRLRRRLLYRVYALLDPADGPGSGAQRVTP